MAGERHTPVLLQEVLEHLGVRAQGNYVDCTFGRGGHSREILRRIGPGGQLLVIDRDPQAVTVARQMAEGDARVCVAQGAFGELAALCARIGMNKGIDGILFDLGASSPQLEEAQRGFSYVADGPLDMRMDPKSGESAATWLGRASEREIAAVLKDYGEERYARRIARAIVKARSAAPITTTRRLAEVVVASKPRWERSIHPATRSFQAIRIHINRELDELKRALPQAVELLREGGRLLVISFHSLEDRIVKRFMRDSSSAERTTGFGELRPATRPSDLERPTLRRVGRPIRPGADEIARNPRARSAILRVAERLA